MRWWWSGQSGGFQELTYDCCGIHTGQNQALCFCDTHKAGSSRWEGMDKEKQHSSW